MKNSQFNYFLKYDSNTVLFNTLTSRLVLMDPLLENLYQAAVENEEVAALKAYHETFYDHLEKIALSWTVRSTRSSKSGKS